ncbi:hypothetical protein DI53_2155 [Sphingobacterium deserti]|uniref:Cardiolipin synthase N-terminal domain-containing protein n=2 Tax=Sphingobacterium deserti TaxID=1229276 RepID=A0A0B8T0N1_9SPHI|nr:hypothetical protein DI53_2155 [Sphingobacterium deserti]
MTSLFINIGRQEIFILVFFVPVILAYLYCIFHALTNRKLELPYRLAWAAAMLGLPFIGCALYWTAAKNASENKQA